MKRGREREAAKQIEKIKYRKKKDKKVESHDVKLTHTSLTKEKFTDETRNFKRHDHTKGGDEDDDDDDDNDNDDDDKQTTAYC